MSFNSGACGSLDKAGVKFFYIHDAARTSQAPPVQNTWYTVLDTTEDVILYRIEVEQTNDETAAKNVAGELIIDGSTYSTARSANDSTVYNWKSNDDVTEDFFWSSTPAISTHHYTPAHGQSVRFRVRTTSAPGTNQTLTCIVWYGRLRTT